MPVQQIARHQHSVSLLKLRQKLLVGAVVQVGKNGEGHILRHAGGRDGVSRYDPPSHAASCAVYSAFIRC